MNNKRVLIITFVLCLIAGTGTFVFASNQGNFDEEEIDYRKSEPTYKEVNPPVKEETPVIPDPVIDNPQIEDENNGIQGNTSNNNATTNPTIRIPNISSPSKVETPNKVIVKDKIAPTVKVRYSPENKTKGPVTVAITANEPIKPVAGWTLSQNQLTLSRAFTSNAKGTLTISDLAGNTVQASYDIKNIDNVAPKAEVTTSNGNGYKVTYKDITVTINVDEEIKPVEGWTLSEDKLTLTKSFKENKRDTIIIEDLVGNKTSVNYEVKNYDSTSPEMTINKTINSDGTTSTLITLTYKEPIDDTWVLNENNEYTKTQVINNNSETPIIITLKDGIVKTYNEFAPKIDINISNQNPDGSFNKTNQPVQITITSNIELKELAGWNLSEDKKTLTKLIYEVTPETEVVVYDIYGDSTTKKYSVGSVDTTYPDIKRIEWEELENGEYLVTLTTTEFAKSETQGWEGTISGYARMFEKVFTKAELEEGKPDSFTFVDKYNLRTTKTIIITYNNGKINNIEIK